MRHDRLELSVTEAVRRLGFSRKPLSGIPVEGTSPEIAIRLNKVFGGGSDARYRLQSVSELAQAKKKAQRVKAERWSPEV